MDPAWRAKNIRFSRIIQQLEIAPSSTKILSVVKPGLATPASMRTLARAMRISPVWVDQSVSGLAVSFIFTVHRRRATARLWLREGRAFKATEGIWKFATARRLGTLLLQLMAARLLGPTEPGLRYSLQRLQLEKPT